MEITQKILDYAANTQYDDIPAQMRELQKSSLKDAIGCILAASGVGIGCDGFIRYAAARGNAQTCHVFGTGIKSDPVSAALANGAMAHALDYEDSNACVMMHPNAVSAPALLTIADEKGGISGKELLTALVIANELVCRFANTFNEDLEKYGWQMSPVFGALASVIAISKVLHYDRNRTLDAIADCLFQATGSSEFGNSKQSVMRAVRDGFGAKAAVTSCLLAEYDIPTRFDAPFEGSKGFFNAYGAGKHDIQRLVDGLGTTYIAEHLTFKAWPTCHGTQPGMWGLKKLMEDNDIRFEDILDVHVRISEFCKKILMEPREVKNRPVNAITGKFSIPYTLGLIAKRGDASLKDFEADRIADEDIYRFAEKLTYEVDTAVRDRGCNVNAMHLTVKTTKGTYECDAEHCPGEPEMPMSEEMARNKFFNCAELAKAKYSPDHIQQIYDTLCRVEELEDVRTLTELL